MIAVIKYNAGNIQSVLFALERLGVSATVTDAPETIQSADKVIFPGVGEASTAMKYLKEKSLDKLIRELRQPVLGICLGMQLMCTHSEENNTPCIGIFDETIKHFAAPAKDRLDNKTHFKIPQIGWNNIYALKSSLFKDLQENAYCYFVHGYYAAIGKHTIAKTDYILPYSSALNKDNFYGVQFHPEKSAESGERILSNFLNLQ